MRLIIIAAGMISFLAPSVYADLSGAQPIEIGEIKKIHKPDDQKGKVSLISEQYETSPNEEVLVPFTVNNVITSPPYLNMSFMVQSRGHCQVTYEYTEISLNDEVIEELDFREYEDEQEVSIDIPLPVDLIRKGKNELRIAMGACDYDIDTMQLNQTTLIF